MKNDISENFEAIRKKKYISPSGPSQDEREFV